MLLPWRLPNLEHDCVSAAGAEVRDGPFSTRSFATFIALLQFAAGVNLFGISLVHRTPTEWFYEIAYLPMFFISLALLWRGWSGL
jgi:hypothetical protein